MPRRSPRELLVRVLGSVCVERGGERVALPPSKKTRALLGYLLVEAREQTREHLCSLFWDLPDDPRGALRWSLSRLRPLLDDPGQGRVIADRERVRIDLEGARLDLKLAQSVRLPEAGADELRAAADLFRGDLLEGLELCDAFRFQAWCTARREEARKLHADVLRALVARLAGRPEEALAPARKLVELLPAEEGAHRTVMELLGRLGRQKEAVAQYDALREILRATTGTRPSSGIEHLRRSLGAEAPLPPPSRPAPAAPPSSPLIGRKKERARIEGASSAVLLLGEPGIGKTRLLEEIAQGAAGLVLSGRCYEAEQGRPYGCIIEALRASGVAATAGDVLRRDLGALLSELAPPPEGLDRARLFDAVAALLRDRAPVLLLLDDVQWIDEASAALTHYLMRSARGLRVILAAREGELSDNAAALRLRRELRRERSLEEVRLAPLAKADIAELMRSRRISADAAVVHAQSAGNPLWALELGRALAEGNPLLSGGLAEALEQRLEALDPAWQSLVGWAAALGSAADPALLARVTGRPEAEIVDAFAQLERRGLARMADRGWDFAHDLIREAALRRIPPARRKLLHATLARTLWESGGPGQLAGSVARQAVLGGEDELAVRASIEASKQALRVFAGQEALAFAQQATGLLPALRGPERLRAYLELLQVRARADRRPERLERTVEELSRLVLDAEASGVSDVVADALHLISWAQYYREDEAGALHVSLRGAEVARSDPDPTVRSRALAQAGRCLAQIEREPEHTAQLLDEAAAAAQSARVEVLDIPLGRGLLATFLGDEDGARRHLDAVARLALESGDLWRHSQAAFALCVIALDRREGDVALRVAEATVPLVDKMPEGDEPLLGRALLALARLLVARGEDREAAALFATAVEQLRAHEARWRLAQVLILRGELELWLGRLPQAEEAAAQLRALGESDVIQMRQGRAHVLMAELALARGEKAAAREYLARALTAPGSIGARLRARIAAAAARAGLEGGIDHAEVRRRA
jgi:DNA-binding SARP family transcriptional activator